MACGQKSAQAAQWGWGADSLGAPSPVLSLDSCACDWGFGVPQALGIGPSSPCRRCFAPGSPHSTSSDRRRQCWGSSGHLREAPRPWEGLLHLLSPREEPVCLPSTPQPLCGPLHRSTSRRSQLSGCLPLPCPGVLSPWGGKWAVRAQVLHRTGPCNA